MKKYRASKVVQNWCSDGAESGAFEDIKFEEVSSVPSKRGKTEVILPIIVDIMAHLGHKLYKGVPFLRKSLKVLLIALFALAIVVGLGWLIVSAVKWLVNAVTLMINNLKAFVIEYHIAFYLIIGIVALVILVIAWHVIKSVKSSTPFQDYDNSLSPYQQKTSKGNVTIVNHYHINQK